MPRLTDIRACAATLYFLPVSTRVPLKFGHEVVTRVTCARVCLRVEDRQGRSALGWGETPLSASWVWPSHLSYAARETEMTGFCTELAAAWAAFPEFGHAMEVGYAFQENLLSDLLAKWNGAPGRTTEPMPWLAALVCCSVFDLALHDAFGQLAGRPIYETYTPEFMNFDLARYLVPAKDADVNFFGRYPRDFLVTPAPASLPVWHLVGGLDPLEPAEVTGAPVNDGYPVLLRDWIAQDGLQCLKIKLRGNDRAWDFERIVEVGRVARDTQVHWLTVDFNCTVTDPDYVNSILDELRDAHPETYGAILYVEQPFPYDLEKNHIDVRSVSARKPLFMDESAHGWQQIALGRELGWTSVALKTCKTQTGAILGACWAKAHGMTLMVQDLTNPMLAMIPHVQLAAHVGTIMGVECNAMQFYPDASTPEAAVHPGLYQRRHGVVDLTSIRGAGFGYRLEEIARTLPAAAASFGSMTSSISLAS
jgi:L-alanine-DL-glutamate epimerase-like enolase superfamily enzyme